MTIVYFDTSAFSNLWQSPGFSEIELRRVRRRMCSQLFARRPVMLIGPKIITEMAAFEGRPLFRKELEYLRSLPTALYARSQFERMKAEVAGFSTGVAANVFLSPEEASAILDGASRYPHLWQDERDQLARNKSVFTQSEIIARRAILANAGEQAAVAGRVKAWFADPNAVVTDWARTIMRKFRLELGLPSKEEAWPAPSSLPTVWAYAAYMVARIFLVNRDGRKIDENDFADWSHYTAAAHADQLVTDDGRFNAIVQCCPAPKPQAVSFKQWASGILAGAG